MQRIRILQVLASGAVGGGATHLRVLASGLDPRRFEVHVACSSDGPLARDLSLAGLPVWPVELGGRLNLAAARPLYRLSRDLRFDAVHFHGTRSGLPGALAARLSGARGIYTVHGWACHPRENRFLEALSGAIEKVIVRASHFVVCVSEGDRRTGLAHGLLDPARCRVIPNGVDPPMSADSPEQARATLGLASGDRGIGLVGRLTRQKGQAVLLEAAPYVLRVHPDAVFVLIGDGEDRATLEDQARRRGIAERVRFVGTRHDVPDLMTALDVFVLPSFWEGMPISLLEAMAAARPVVASTVNGSGEAIQNGVSGLLIPPGDAGALASAIVELLGDPALAARLGDAARERVRRTYHVRGMIAATSALYEDLIAGASR